MFVRPKIVVVGSINADIILRVAALPLPSETILSRDTRTAIGGKGLNQAVAAARLGAEVTLIAAIGDDDFGATALEHLDRHQIGRAHVHVVADQPTGAAHIMVGDDATNMIVVSAGANGALTPAMIDDAGDVIGAADALVVQLEVPMPIVKRALQIARAQGVRTFLNPAPAHENALTLLSEVDVVTPNETELARLTGIDGGSDAALHAGLHAMRRMGAGMAIVTLGDRGSAALIDGRLAYQSAFRVKAVDTTGAGDIFHAALVCELSQGSDLLPAMEFASAASALSVSGISADTAPSREEVEEFLADSACKATTVKHAVALGID